MLSPLRQGIVGGHDRAVRLTQRTSRGTRPIRFILSAVYRGTGMCIACGFGFMGQATIHWSVFILTSLLVPYRLSCHLPVI